MLTPRILIGCFLAPFWIAASAWAAEVDATPVKVTTVVAGLDHPCGVAVQPAKGHVFVCEAGSGRILRLSVSGNETAIGDFPKAKFTGGLEADAGALGLAFVNRNLLAVGVRGVHEDGRLICFYDVPPLGKSIAAGAAKHSVGPWAQDGAPSAQQRFFHGLVFDGAENIYFTSMAADGRGWIAKSEITDGQPQAGVPLVETRPGATRSAGLVVSPRGELVVGQIGTKDKPDDSALCFYDPRTRRLLLKAPLKLNDVAALAYSGSGLLYAADYSGSDASGGGVYRLDRTMVDGVQTVKAVRIAKLDRPTAMAFAANGALYVTVFGPKGGDEKQKTGSLVRLMGKL